MDKESESGLPETVASCFQKLWEGEMVRRYGSGLLNRTKEGKRGLVTPKKHPSSKCLFQQTPYLNACSLCPVSPSLFFFLLFVCFYLFTTPPWFLPCHALDTCLCLHFSVPVTETGKGQRVAHIL